MFHWKAPEAKVKNKRTQLEPGPQVGDSKQLLGQLQDKREFNQCFFGIYVPNQTSDKLTLPIIIFPSKFQIRSFILQNTNVNKNVNFEKLFLLDYDF